VRGTPAAGGRQHHRNRLSLAATFLRWSSGRATPARGSGGPDRPGQPPQAGPRLDGKVQAKHPARWLTREEAFGQLLSTCAADGEVGLRDEVVLRLGLAWLPAAEIIAREFGDRHLADTIRRGDRVTLTTGQTGKVLGVGAGCASDPGFDVGALGVEVGRHHILVWLAPNTRAPHPESCSLLHL